MHMQKYQRTPIAQEIQLQFSHGTISLGHKSWNNIIAKKYDYCNYLIHKDKLSNTNPKLNHILFNFFKSFLLQAGCKLCPVKLPNPKPVKPSHNNYRKTKKYVHIHTFKKIKNYKAIRKICAREPTQTYTQKEWLKYSKILHM